MLCSDLNEKKIQKRINICKHRAESQVGLVVKNPPTNAGDVGSIPAQEDPLEKEMATHSSILAWKIPWTEEPGGLQSMGLKRVTHDCASEHLLLIHFAVQQKLPQHNKAAIDQQYLSCGVGEDS